jgi:hypothetical protein
MMKLANANATRASKTTATSEMAPTELLLGLERAAREAEDAEDILSQAEEANALDPVG